MRAEGSRSRRILLSVPHMGGSELGYVQEAFATNWLSTVGPNLTALEAEFERRIGLPCAAVSSGTSGLHLALRLAGVGPGDEVLSPTLTFVASANPILQLGARPVFVDSERATWNVDPVRLEEAIKACERRGRVPKAAVVVHLFGQPAAMPEILAICRSRGIAVIEDAAESLGSRLAGAHPGTLGDVGVFSFNGNKIITGTTGGMVVSGRPGWVEKARHWSTQARDPDPAGVGNYHHTESGYNYRMSNVIAGIVRGQLGVLEQRVTQRRAVFDRYREAFADLPGIEAQPDRADAVDAGPAATYHSRWLSCFLVDPERFGRTAADLIRWLDADGIEARPVWKPMHLQPLFSGATRFGGDVAEDLNQRGICLPSSSSLDEADQARVIRSVRAAAGRP